MNHRTMNYLAHAIDCRDPYETAGRAVPDWLAMTRPRLRCRSRHAAPHVASPRPRLAAVARGVVRHHADDDWFHHTPAFAEVTLELARRIRAATGDADGMRPGLVGHILTEMLLDDALAARRPQSLDAYYAALSLVDPQQVALAVAEMSGCDASQLAAIVERFVQLRFLFDYSDDDLLLFRLNQVMRRVRLPELPAELTAVLPTARTLVAEAQERLMSPGAACPRGAVASLAS